MVCALTAVHVSLVVAIIILGVFVMRLEKRVEDLETKPSGPQRD